MICRNKHDSNEQQSHLCNKTFFFRIQDDFKYAYIRVTNHIKNLTDFFNHSKYQSTSATTTIDCAPQIQQQKGVTQKKIRSA